MESDHVTPVGWSDSRLCQFFRSCRYGIAIVAVPVAKNADKCLLGCAKHLDFFSILVKVEFQGRTRLQLRRLLRFTMQG
ncbi:MAG: hypothetical protein A2V70_00140 [Planctomycetes bacterium RBG_13_63_9]|nr:MAG: hypothetical protein A2V70_00140 [Planctomycetes bacterium RBG_13_63_9]